MVGGLGYSVDELLASPWPGTFDAGVEWIHQITGGIAPGEVWAVTGVTGVGVTTLVRRLSVAAAQRGTVILANGHVPSRVMAQSIADQSSPSNGSDVRGALPQIASWLPLPRRGTDGWDSACEQADVVVLDTWDEMWRPHDWTKSREERLADARWLRELARSAGTALVLTARLPRSRTRAPHWAEEALDNVADVSIELKQEADSPWRLARVHSRAGGSRQDRLPFS